MCKTPVRNGFYRAIIGFYLAVFWMAMLINMSFNEFICNLNDLKFNFAYKKAPH